MSTREITMEKPFYFPNNPFDFLVEILHIKILIGPHYLLWGKHMIFLMIAPKRIDCMLPMKNKRESLVPQRIIIVLNFESSLERIPKRQGYDRLHEKPNRILGEILFTNPCPPRQLKLTPCSELKIWP